MNELSKLRQGGNYRTKSLYLFPQFDVKSNESRMFNPLVIVMLLIPFDVKLEPLTKPQNPDWSEFSNPPQNPEQQVPLKRQRPPRGRQHDRGWTNSSLSGTFPFKFLGSQQVGAMISGPPADGGETPSKHLL